MVKYKALLGEKFDKSKITVVGSPTITNDGVASGFTASNYLQLPQVFNADGEFEIILKVKTPKEVTASNYIMSYLTNGYGMGLLISSSGKLVWDIHRDASSYNLTISGKVISLDTDYFIKLSYKNNIYSLDVSTNNITWENQGSKQSDIPLNDCSSYTRIGVNGAYNIGGIYNGSIDLPSFKICIDNQLVYTPTKPTYLLERRKPKVWNKNNYSVVGSPTITNDGLATYINGSNYVYIPPIDYTKSFAIKKMGFTRASWGGNYYFVNGSNINEDFGGFTIGTNGANYKLRWFLGSTGIDWNIAYGRETATALELNTLYYVDLIYSGKDYTVILYDSYYRELERMTVNNSTPLYQSGQGIMFGSNFVGNGLFNGTIYLSKLTVENDGVVVFDGGAETYMYDPSKFTVVGSPTITEAGVASGFNSGNYVEVNFNLDNNFELITNFKCKLGTAEQRIWSVLGSGSTVNYFALVQTADNTLQLRVPNSTASFFVSALNYNPADNENIWVKLKISGNSAQGFISSDGINWELKSTVTTYEDLASLVSGVIRLGTYSTFSMVGSINLPSISITVDGKEVFTGAKEQFYMMKG